MRFDEHAIARECRSSFVNHVWDFKNMKDEGTNGDGGQTGTHLVFAERFRPR